MLKKVLITMEDVSDHLTLLINQFERVCHMYKMISDKIVEYPDHPALNGLQDKEYQKALIAIDLRLKSFCAEVLHLRSQLAEAFPLTAQFAINMSTSMN